MLDMSTILTIGVFFMTIVFLMWRPWGINESIPPTIGATIIIIAGIVSFSDLFVIYQTVSGAITTILSTIVMSIVLDSIGFFRWSAYYVVVRAKGSGIRLYWYITLLCFLMTLFFNNDGSILITTPIIIQIVTILNLKMHQKLPYLISGALVATASSAPIGVSNLANLIAMKIVGLDLNSYVVLMFVPSMIGICSISFILFLYFRKDIPLKIAQNPADSSSSPLSVPRAYYSLKTIERWIRGREMNQNPPYHPLKEGRDARDPIDWWLFRTSIYIVILIRLSLFAGSSVGIPIEWVAIAGPLILIALRWYRTGIGITDLIHKTPWYTLLFAFSIYVVVYALHNIGMTTFMVNHLKEFISQSEFYAVMGYGLLLTVMSNMLNNLPSVMLGTLVLKEMNLDTHILQIAYLANIIGSDIGSLITPMGTLASLIWMFILRKNKIKLSWMQYIKVTIIVIPIGLFISLLSLYLWIKIIS
ncbi:MAG: arsenic transporter [Bacilli bacterium]|nr:arsenic transporter [Bacilli bacterium]